MQRGRVRFVRTLPSAPRGIGRPSPPARSLRFDDGLYRPRGSDWIGMAVENLPLPVFPPEDGGHPKGYRGFLPGSPDFRPGTFDFDDVSKVSSSVPGDPFELGAFSVPELGRSPFHCFLHLAPAPDGRP